MSRRNELIAMYDNHIENRERIDALIGLTDASFVDDARATLRLADIGRLRLLLRMLREDHVIRQSYRGMDERGCWGFFAFGWVSNSSLLDYDFPSEGSLFTAIRAVRAWDFQKPNTAPSTLRRIVEEVISERLQLNAQENATIRGAAVRSPRQTANTTE